MTLQTNPAERREMVQAISERLGSPAVYLRTPTYAYRIGGLTVERDGSIISDDDALLEALRPMLIERGWLTDAEASVTKTEPTEQDSEITQMELSFPVEDWTVPQLKNFLHTPVQQSAHSPPDDAKRRPIYRPADDGAAG